MLTHCYCYISDATLSHICLTMSSGDFLQYSLHLRYIAGRCIGFAIILFTGLKYTVQSSHSALLCPLFTKFCFNPSFACDALITLSAYPSLQSSPTYPSTSLVPRSNLSNSTVACHRWLAVGKVLCSSILSPSSA
jgi:hypothetical protein